MTTQMPTIMDKLDLLKAAATQVYKRVKCEYEKALVDYPELQEDKAADVEIDSVWLPFLQAMFAEEGFECSKVDDVAEQDWVIAIRIQPDPDSNDDEEEKEDKDKTYHEIVLTPETCAEDFRFFTSDALWEVAGTIGVDRYNIYMFMDTGKNEIISRIVNYCKRLKAPKWVGFETCFSRSIDVPNMTVKDLLFTLSEDQLFAAAAVCLNPSEFNYSTDLETLAKRIKESEMNIGI